MPYRISGRINPALPAGYPAQPYSKHCVDAGRAVEAAAASDRQRHRLLQAVLRRQLAQHGRPAAHGPHLCLPGQQGRCRPSL